MRHIEIHLKNTLDPSWSDWLFGMTICPISPEESILYGELPDNPAIYGLLSSLSSLGVTLISVSITDKDEVSEASHLEKKDGGQNPADVQSFGS